MTPQQVDHHNTRSSTNRSSRNPSLLKHLPTGFTATATTQLAGRGRGNNVWVSPPGSLMFSTVVHHPLVLTQSAPVVFVQYLVGLAIIQGIQSYEPGYASIPVKLKWPNDIYALNPSDSQASNGKASGSSQSSSKSNNMVKIGGILVNSSYAGSDYTLVAGVGLNVANAAPTTSLNALASASSPPLPPFQVEKLLARILSCFESIYTRFCREGWDRDVEGMYYDNWLHT